MLNIQRIVPIVMGLGYAGIVAAQAEAILMGRLLHGDVSCVIKQETVISVKARGI